MASFRYRAPKTDDEFEEFCLALYKLHLASPGLTRYGRRGQRQHGIDLIDLESPPPHVAIQCKAEGIEAVYPERSLRSEVDKALTAPFKLKRFIVLSTSKTSTELQIAISQINAAHMEIGQFIVEFKGWDEIERVLDDYPDVAQNKLSIITNSQLSIVNEGLASLTADLTEIRSAISNNEFDAEISSAREEIERRDFPLAKQRLLRLRRDKWEKLADEQRFLVLANLGHIEAAKNLPKQGSALMLEAIQYAKGTLKNRELEAHFHFLRNENAKTYELAATLKAEHPESWKATMFLIHSAPNSSKFDDLLAHTTEQDLLRQEVLLALAYRALGSRLYDIGQKYAEDAVATTDEPWPVTKLTLAQCISHNVLLGSGAKPVEGLTADDKELLGRAKGFLEEAVAGAKERGEGYIAAQASIELAGIAERQDDEKSARTFVEDAYRFAPDDSSTQGAYATLLQRMGDIDRAIAILEQLLLEPIGRSGFKRQLAELLVSRSRGDDEQRAAKLLTETCLADDPFTLHFRYSTFIEALGALAKVGRISEGQSLIDSASAAMLSPVARLAITARLFLLKEDKDSAKSCITAAKNQLTEDSVDTEIQMMAATSYAIGEYRDALALWRRISGIHNPFATHQAMVCARRLGDHATTLELCRGMREAGIDDEESAQIEADLILDDDFEGAIAVLKSFLDRHPDNSVIRLRISYEAIRRGRPDLLQRPCDALPDVETITPYFARAVTYFLKYTHRHEEALQYGYKVLHRYFDDVDAHRAYMLLFVPMGPPIDFAEFDRVALGAAVEYLEDGTDTPRWHVIEDVVNPDSKLNEYLPSHSLSKSLLGKSLGDTVALSPGKISDRTATIRQISNKYVYRYQCCISELQIRFPEATELQSMHIPRLADGEPDVSGLVATLEKQLSDRQHAIEQYSLHTMPLHFVAEILGKSTFEAVLHLAHDPKSIVRCAPQNPHDKASAATALTTAAEVVLELSAVATLFLCNALDQVHRLGLPIVISQGCAEELDRIMGKTHDGSPRAGLHFAWQDEKIVGIEVTEQLQAEREEYFTKQLEKIRAVALVEPCRELSSMNEETKKPLIAVFGRHGAQSILLAKKPGRILWSDDFVQSSIAAKEYGVRVAWTEMVLASSEAKGLISRKEAVSAVTKLLGYRYEVLTITPAIFVEAARCAAWDKRDSPFKEALRPLITLPFNENIFAIIGGIASETNLEVAENKKREIIIRSFLETIAERKDGIKILSLIARVFQRIQTPLRNEWVPVINDVITGTAIDFMNKTAL